MHRSFYVGVLVCMAAAVYTLFAINGLAPYTILISVPLLAFGGILQVIGAVSAHMKLKAMDRSCRAALLAMKKNPRWTP